MTVYKSVLKPISSVDIAMEDETSIFEYKSELKRESPQRVKKVVAAKQTMAAQATVEAMATNVVLLMLNQTMVEQVMAAQGLGAPGASHL